MNDKGRHLHPSWTHQRNLENLQSHFVSIDLYCLSDKQVSFYLAGILRPNTDKFFQSCKKQSARGLLVMIRVQSYRWDSSQPDLDKPNDSIQFFNFTFVLYFIIDTNVWCRALQVIVLIKSKVVILKRHQNFEMIKVSLTQKCCKRICRVHHIRKMMMTNISLAVKIIELFQVFDKCLNDCNKLKFC